MAIQREKINHDFASEGRKARALLQRDQQNALARYQQQSSNLLQQIGGGESAYWDAQRRKQLQSDYDRYMVTLGQLGLYGMDTDGDMRTMRRAVDSVLDFQNQFKDENDFNVSYAYPKKYKGKTRKDVNAALTQLKNTPGAEAEYDWLNKNQMNYWSVDELKEQINAWRNEVSGIERQRRNMPHMAAGSTDADYAKRQQEALALSGQIDERKAKIGKAQSLLTQKTYDEEISKWDTQMQKALSDYSKALSVDENARMEMAMAGNRAFVVQNSDYATNASNTVRSFEQQLRDYGYSDQQINGIRHYALTQQHANEAAEMAQQVAQEAKEHPWLYSAMSVGTNMMAGAGALDIAAQNVFGGTDPFTGEKMAVDRYTKSMVPSTVTNTIRGSVSEDMSGIGSFLYNTGMSMADSLATLAIGGATGLHGAADVILGGAAASQAITDAYDRGASDSQAMSVGLLYGTAEALFEHISLDKLRMFHTSAAAGKKTAKTLVKDMLKQSFVEGSEEVCTDIANVISDAIVMADKSEINQTIAAYQADGMSEDEATRRAWLDWLGQTAQDFAGGAISGGVMTGGDMALNAGMRSANYRETGRQITASDYADILRHAAEESGDENLRKLAGKKQTNRNTGKLYEATQEANLTQAVSDRLGALGTPENDVQELTGLVVKQIKGQELTRKEQRKFDASKQVQRAANEYASLFTRDADRTTNAWARSHMRDASELERNAIYGGARKTDAGQTKAHQAEKNAEVQVNGTTAQVQELRYDQESGSVELSVKAENGDVQRVSVKDAKLPDGTRLLAESAEKYGETAPQMYANYQNGQDVERYANAYEVAYSYGRAGVKNYAVLENSGAASYLTPEQRKFAYETGLAAARRESDAKSAAAKSSEIQAGSVTLEGGKLGNVTLAAVNTAGLTRKQTASIDVARKVAEATGVNVVFFESQTGEDGKYLGMNGAYRDGTIYLDVNAGKNNVDIGETAILKTMSHELTHFIQRNSGQYEALKEFVANHVLESGDSIERLARKKLDNDSTGELTMDGAMDEVVADACEMMLRNTEAVQRLANDNRSLAEKIRDWIGDFVKKLRAAFKGDRATHDEARAMLDRMQELQKLWDDALVDAAKTKAANGKTDFDHAGQVTDENGEFVAESNGEGAAVFSLRTYDEDGREYLRKWLDRAEQSHRITHEDAVDIQQQLEQIYRICKEYEGKYAPFGAWSEAEVVRGENGKPVFSVIKQNGEYAMNLDFSLVCKKRRTLDAVLNELVRRGVADNMNLGKESIVRINDIIHQHGFETACKLCFVDAKRYRQASVSDTFVDLYNGLVKSLVPSGSDVQIDYFNYGGDSAKLASGAGIDAMPDSALDFSHVDEVLRTYGKLTAEHKAAKYIRENAAARKLVSRSDFLSSYGFGNVKRENPELLGLYNSKKGSAGPKAAFGDVQYLNDILPRRNWSAKKAYAVGGVRAQSFSDYVPRMVFDYAQMIADLSAKKLPAHAYTKEPLFVKQFGLTGMKINMSLIPAVSDGGVSAGLDANGNYVWADESFDYDTAMDIQKADGYRDNCGTICVGVSDAHIRKLMSDPNIRMVIPYHKSGLNPIVAHMVKISEFTDYTDFQNTRYANGTKLNVPDAKREPNFNQILHDMGANGSPQAAAQKYLDWCEEHGYLPKFDQFAYRYENGERVMDENYYKLLEDFTTLVDGEYHAQEAVKMVFPDESSAFGSIASLIEEGLDEDAVLEGRRTENVGGICDEIEKQIGGVQFSERERDDVVSQEITSAKTSIKQVAGLFKDKNAKFGKTNIDVGGGRFNLVTDYLAERGTKNMVFDPYNRGVDENTATLRYLQNGGRSDTATCANVLNVIREPDARANVILEVAKCIRDSGTAYFTVYEGDGSGEGRQTSSGWQNNRKTADYVSEIGRYFDDVQRKGKLIIATNPKENLPKASWEVEPGRGVQFSLREYSENEKKQHIADAEKYFGKTYKWAETGYLTPGGTKLDFSGRHDGAPGGYRTVDHRDIRDALGLDYGGEDYSGSMIQFMREGNIRIMPENGGINLIVKPTQQQEDALVQFVQRNRGEVMLDIDDVNGNTIASVEYGRGTRSTTVIGAIRDYFDYGVVPESPDVQFSERDDTRTDRDVLSDAADGDAANVREMEMLREYREKLQKYSSLTRRLEQQRELAQNAESKEERLKARNRADNLAAQVSRADAQLTRMQNAKPLRELVARELKTRDSLAKENAMLRDRVEYWRGQTRRTEEATTDPKAVREAAKNIIKQTGSSIGEDEVTGRLQELYDGIARATSENGLSQEDIWKHAYDLAHDILDDVSVREDTMYREYADLRKYFKGKQLVVSAADRGEIPDFGDFRRRNMGRMRLKNGERTNVDQVYAELSELYPEFFDQNRESQPSDQLYRIADVLDAVYSVNEYNPNAQYMREATQSVSNEILEQFFDLPQQRTFADRQAKKDEQQKTHYLNQINELRKANDTRIAELRAQNRKRLQEAIAREREKRDEQIARLKDRNAEDKARREESAAVAKYRPRIEQKAKRLSDWLLKNSDKEHIPEPLKLSVGEFLESIDFTSKRALGGGALTKKDIQRSLRYTDRMQKLLDSLRGQNEDGTSDLGLYLDIPDGFLEEMQKHINTASDIISQNPGENVVNRMNGEQLQQLDRMLTILTRSIQNANKLKANAHFETARQAAQATVLELGRLGQAKGRTKAGEKVAGFFNWENTTPYYAFQRFGEGGKAIFEALSAGWDQMAFNTKKVMRFTEQTYKPEEVKAWSKETHTLKLESGKTVKMTTAQMMAFYCLSKREQAIGHLLGGGMRVEDIQNSGRKENIKQAEPFLLTQEDIATINGALTKRQREVADKLQKYMTKQGSEWGNRVSMERFGYRAFTEENYFPIETMDSERDAKDPGAKENDMFRLLNMSATKSLVYKANNALVVHDIFDVFANHMTDMAKYDALALPILDAMKWYNYREKQKLENGHVLTTTVQRSIEQAYGTDANKYFTTFIKDLNGVNEGGRGEGFAKKMLSNYKVAAVAANLRVALLQPTAYVRAVGVMNPKYLAKGLSAKSGYKEAEAHSGIALWKQMGFYDTNIGRGVRDQIKNSAGVKDWIVEKAMIGAEWGDRLTWGHLWNACKAEVRDKQKLTGDALLKATAERFREVVYSTQVVDSTMTRSQAMRATGVYGAVSTAFMSEPTMSYNLLLKAYTDYTAELRATGDKKAAWRNASGKVARALAAYLVSAAVSGLFESIVDACRDDDEYATWLEKYLGALIGAKYKDGKFSGVNPLESNLFMNVDILSKLPILKDFVSLASGYSNGRMDTEWIKNLIDAYRIWDETIKLDIGKLDKPTDVTYNGNMTLYGKIYKTLKAFSQIAGLPANNTVRDVIMLWNTIAGAVGKGDEWTIHTYDSGPENQIKYGLRDGYLTREEAQQLLVDKGLADDEDDAYWKVDKWATGEGKYDEALAAVLSGDKAAFDAQAKELKEHGIGEKQLQSAVRSQTEEWYVGDDDGKRSITKEQALKILQQYGGKDADEAQKLVQKWTCEVVTGTDYDDIKDLYLDGKLTRSRAVDMLVRYGGMKQEDAQNKIDTADFVKAHPECDGISVEAVQKYNEQAKPAGLDAGTFWEAYQFKNDAMTTRDSNGKAISGQGAMDKVAAYIDGLNISSAQKSALFLCFYSQKSLGKIRWSN